MVFGLDFTDVKTLSSPEHFVLCWHSRDSHGLSCAIANLLCCCFFSAVQLWLRLPKPLPVHHNGQKQGGDKKPRESEATHQFQDVTSWNPLASPNSSYHGKSRPGQHFYRQQSLELVHSTFPQASSQQPSNLEYLEAPHSPPSHLQRSHQSLSPVWNEAFGLLRSSSWHSYFGCTSCQHSYVKCGLDISTHVINFHLYIINQSGCIHAMHTHQIYPREVFNTFGKFLYKEFMLCVRLCLHLF